MYPNLWRVKRRILGYRQRDLADKLKISQARYSLLERGEAIPTSEELNAIGIALGFPDALLEEAMRAVEQANHTKP